MSVVAFLASTVDADVAAAAARTTFKKLGMSSNEPRVKKETETGEMDVDKKKESATEDEQEEEEDKAISGEEKAAATAPVPNYEEEKRISKLTCQFIGKQVEKFEMRLAQFQELEAVVEVEKRHIERERHQLYQDRTNFKKIQYEVQAEIAKRQPPPQPQPAIPNGMSPAQLQQLSMQQQQQQQQPIPGQLAYAQQQQQQFMRAQQYRDMMLQQQQQSMPPYHGYNSMRMQ
jgi:SWI/SNF related-matrix-associated actin-dependent regulator of chromatin subfamily C